MGWLRNNLRDAVELWLLPGCAAVLPWRVCFVWFRLLARIDGLYREAVDASVEQALALGWIADGDATTWRRRRRLLTLVDHADLFLANTRSDAFMRRHLAVQGAWPAADEAAVLCTFHWGAGMWGLRHARACGLRARALAAVPRREHLAGRPLLWWYACWRTRTAARALGGDIVDVQGSMKPVIEQLNRGRQMVAVVDVPADAVDGGTTVSLLDRPVGVPRGLIRVAAARRLPTVVYYTGLDERTGRRYLGIEPAMVDASAQALADNVFAVLDRIVRENPVAWHFWGQMPRFMAAARPVPPG